MVTDFTPYASLFGGILIGLGAVMLMAFNGRIAGMTAMLGGVLEPQNPDSPWRIAFLAGAGRTKLRLAFSARCSDTSVNFVLGFGINTVDPALTRIPAGMALTSRRIATVTPSRFANWSADSVTGTLTAVQEDSGPV
jgi:hypothetical protein